MNKSKDNIEEVTADSEAVALSAWSSYERTVGQVTRNLKTALGMIESKFCYMRWEGLVMLLDLVDVALKDNQRIKSYLGPLMSKYKLQQRVFGLIIDGGQSEKITPVTSKETSIALEILQKCQRMYVVNPHSRGFTILIKLVVETALPQVQIPALRLIRTLVSSSPFCMKSFRKSGGVETLGKWIKEQRGAARVISPKATLDALEAGIRLLATLAEDDGDRKKLEQLLGQKELGDMLETAQQQKPV